MARPHAKLNPRTPLTLNPRTPLTPAFQPANQPASQASLSCRFPLSCSLACSCPVLCSVLCRVLCLVHCPVHCSEPAAADGLPLVGAQSAPSRLLVGALVGSCMITAKIQANHQMYVYIINKALHAHNYIYAQGMLRNHVFYHMFIGRRLGR